MPCTITHGRAEACKEFVGGLRAIYFLNYGVVGPQPTANYGSVDLTDQLNTVTLTPANSTLFKYELKGANSFEQTITSSRENGTTFVEQTLTFTIKGLDAVTTKQIKLLAYGRPHVIIQTNSNLFFLAGLENGMDATTGLIANGTAMGDLQGYTLTLQGMETIPANHLNVAAPYGDTQIKAVTGATSVILAA